MASPALAASDKVSSAKDIRKLQFLDKHVEGMGLDYKVSVQRSELKTLYDFAGNTYTLVECEPTGYMILCDDSATMVEYSGKSPSPYYGFAENLYYGGPTFFYVLQGDTLIHTVTGLQLKYSDVAMPAEKSSTLMHEDLTREKNENALKFIENGIKLDTETVPIYGHNWTVVNNASFFRNKTTYTQMGYVSGGYCGYIAANLLVGYYDTFHTSFGFNSNYMTGSGVNRHFTGGGLTNELISVANSIPLLLPKPQNGSTGTTIRKTMNKFFKNKGVSGTYGSYDMITPFFSGTTLKNKVDSDTPSILFGDLGDATAPNGNSAPGGNHAVVIYGYKSGGTGGALWSLLAHYGWSGFSESTVNYLHYSVFGGMYNVTM